MATPAKTIAEAGGEIVKDSGAALAAMELITLQVWTGYLRGCLSLLIPMFYIDKTTTIA